MAARREADGVLILKTEVRTPAKLSQLQTYTDMRVDVYEMPCEFAPLSMLRALHGVRSTDLSHLLVPRPVFQVSWF